MRNMAVKNFACMGCTKPKSAFQMDFKFRNGDFCKACRRRLCRRRIVTIAQLRVGQRFSWIPKQWFGSGVLLEKTRRNELKWEGCKATKVVKYDLKYDAAVVNPPAIDYGIPAQTKVRILQPTRRKQ